MGWLDASHTSPATPAFLIPPALHGFENLRFEQAEAAGLGTALQETQDSVPSSAQHSGSETNASPCSPATTSVPETALRAWLLMTSSPPSVLGSPPASPGPCCQPRCLLLPHSILPDPGLERGIPPHEDTARGKPPPTSACRGAGPSLLVWSPALTWSRLQSWALTWSPPEAQALTWPPHTAEALLLTGCFSAGPSALSISPAGPL